MKAVCIGSDETHDIDIWGKVLLAKRKKQNKVKLKTGLGWRDKNEFVETKVRINTVIQNVVPRRLFLRIQTE